jgi:hypothetical protein
LNSPPRCASVAFASGGSHRLHDDRGGAGPAQPDPKRDQEHAEHERVRPEPHDQQERSRAVSRGPQGDGEQTREAEQPLALDLLAKPDGRADLERPG